MSEGAVDIAGYALTFNWVFYLLGVMTAGLTAFYMFRLYFLTFEGESRMDEETEKHVHESGFEMALPLVVLGALAFIGGYTGWPHFLVPGVGRRDYMLAFEHWLDEVFYVSDHYRY